MKTLTFQVKVPELEQSTSVLDSIINEAHDEQHRLEVCHKINAKSSKQYKKILQGIVNEMNSTLTKVGLAYETDLLEVLMHNNLRTYATEVKVDIYRYRMSIMPVSCGEGGYTTYKGNYRLQLHVKSTKSYKDYDFGSKVRNGMSLINALKPEEISVERILNTYKESLKEHIKNNNY